MQKLQELIRRGTPRDLAAAQELMKALAGAVSLFDRSDVLTLIIRNLRKPLIMHLKLCLNSTKFNPRPSCSMTCSTTFEKENVSVWMAMHMNKWQRLSGVPGQEFKDGSRKIQASEKE